MSEPILKVEHLNRYFGALHATKDVSFEVPEGQVRAIIGPNGAGKSTLMDLITNRTTPAAARSSSAARISPVWLPTRSFTRA